MRRSSRRLNTLPSTVWKLQDLRELDIRRNKVGVIDDAAAALTHLEILDVRDNGQKVAVPAALRERLGSGLLEDE